MIIGSHVSFKKDLQLLGSAKEAKSYGATTFMFYTGAPQNTNRAKIDWDLTKKADIFMKENNIDKKNLIVHAPYIINLANIKNKDFSISFLKQELRRMEELGVNNLVIHPGSHVGLGVEAAILNISSALNEAMKDNKINILLESMAKKGTEIGTIDELKEIYDKCEFKDRIKICLDTCHLHDAGYDVSNFDLIIDMVEEKIGKNKIGCLHVNDSKNMVGAKKDRHANIGEGFIGLDILKKIVNNERLKSVPKILETPYIKKDDGTSYPPYKEEIIMLTE